MEEINKDKLLHPPSSFTTGETSEEFSTHSPKFKIRRFFTVFVIGLSDMLVFFQRAVPTIVSEPMAKSYGVGVSDLSIFSSMFFYPYAIIQPFAGLLADVMDPRYLIGICSMIASIGAFICGISSSLFLGCLGRLLVGIGSAPIYVPACRTIANWFPLSQYSRAVGIFCAFAGCGGLIAQGPFSLLANAIGWRWCFFIISITGFVLSIIVLIFVRGNPISLGYEAVNLETSIDTSTMNIREKMTQLCRNFVTVVKNISFWFIGLYNFFVNGVFFNVNGMWGGPYLRNVYNYSLIKMGNTMMWISIGNVIGPIIIPWFAELFNTRKWFVFWGTFVAFLSFVPFYFWVDTIPNTMIIILFFIYAVFSNSMTNVAYPMCREYFHASVSATAVGCVNLTAYISTIIYQTGTGFLLDWMYKVPGDSDNKYSTEGYKYVLWLPSLISTFLGMISIMIAKDSPGPGKLSCCCDFNNCKKNRTNQGGDLNLKTNENIGVFFQDDGYNNQENTNTEGYQDLSKKDPTVTEIMDNNTY